MEGTKKIKSMSFHQYSWNSEVETTWISLIGWHHKTSTTYIPASLSYIKFGRLLFSFEVLQNTVILPFYCPYYRNWTNLKKSQIIFRNRQIYALVSLFYVLIKAYQISKNILNYLIKVPSYFWWVMIMHFISNCLL